MGSMNDNNNGSNNNWLGFSLSPHMKMEVTSDTNHHQYHRHHHHQQTQAPASSLAVSNPLQTMFLSTQQLNTSGVCFGAGENGGFHPPLTVMPLKSDGSLCIMEALSRSQQEGTMTSSSPKLENFLGGAMASHHYGCHEREAMPLSLDSIYYHQRADQESYRQDDKSMPVQHDSYFSALAACHGLYQAPLDTETKETQITECNAHITHLADDGMPCLKRWVPRSYSAHHAFEPQMTCSMVDNAGGSSSSVAVLGCADLQSLSLSMSPGSQSSCVAAPAQISASEIDCMAMETRKRGPGKMVSKQPVHRKSIDTFGQRTSQYRGVTKHRWTGRYEAHLWDNSCKKEGQTRKGRQGGYDMEGKAARAYDLAALKYWGPTTHINFPLENYKEELEEMKNMTRQEYVAHLRRKSSGFSRGASMYRGVTRHHQHGRWQARIGRVAGNKDLYLGTFSTQEEAAEAYDIAAIKFRGVNAVTNFDITRYDVEKIMASNSLLAGEQAKRVKVLEPSNEDIENNPSMDKNGGTSSSNNSGNCSDWKMALYPSPQQQQNICLERADLKPIGIENYRGPFPVGLQDLIGIDSVNTTEQMAEDDQLAKLGSIHFSNSSSLLTSLNSSREASPDKSGSSSMLFSKPPLGWIPSAQLRPASAISMAHLPVFSAWSDA
ncbi:hypothetical protein Nepgr_005044 [Nepenthes gracilis]|uniref:AP2/ERF domain-containing protein n=1 Tax=Nepenthes gracilis TaxID=150966 RepID=A0AAD3S2F9_NEPGR|nr:hypothetical protein Nepgr_005044 [Nepenthes gracilis]